MNRALLATLLLFLAPVAASAQTLLFSPNSLPLSGSCGTVTANNPCLDLTQTWNNAGITFYGFRLNVTDTASASASLLMDLQVAGVSKVSVDKAGLLTTSNGLSTQGNISIASAAGYFINNDVRLVRDAANALALRNGANAQTFNVYNTFTDTSNYERLVIGPTGADQGFYTQKAGTGSIRALLFGVNGSTQWGVNVNGHFVATADNTNDIGASGANRPRNEFLAGYLVTQVTTVSGLTACASGLKGARSFVTDANATTFLSTVAGSGANNVPVVCDGTSWKIG